MDFGTDDDDLLVLRIELASIGGEQRQLSPSLR
jgi:hypothetical protein